MAVTIKAVKNRRELRKFIRFNYHIYKDNPYSVPDLYEDMLTTFDQGENHAFAFCKAEYFLAYRGRKVVGRVAAIINVNANKIWERSCVRFGWIDFIDDPEVSEALLRAVEEWGRERGMTEIHGPLGFSDLDAEGMLINGFDQLSTMATIYNYPYYPEHLERLGFKKEAEWMEFKVKVPEAVPEKMERVAELVSQRYHLHVKKLTKKEIKDESTEYAEKIFDLINQCYEDLYAFSEISFLQARHYIDTYLSFLDLDLVTVIEDIEDNVIGIGISMPSIARALQKAKGRLFPFGWIHLLRALRSKKNDIVDLLIVGVRPDYQYKGVNAMIFADLLPRFIQRGFKWAESNPELATNNRVQMQWQYFEFLQHKRRASYIKQIATTAGEASHS